jgi:hypothetical protein
MRLEVKANTPLLGPTSADPERCILLSMHSQSSEDTVHCLFGNVFLCAHRSHELRYEFAYFSFLLSGVLVFNLLTHNEGL